MSKLDDRDDLDEVRYPHGTLARQEEVNRRETEEYHDNRQDEPEPENEERAPNGGVPEEVWRGR